MIECTPQARARSSMVEQWPFKPLVESSSLSALIYIFESFRVTALRSYAMGIHPLAVHKTQGSTEGHVTRVTTIRHGLEK
jgi:hypothetical protein